MVVVGGAGGGRRCGGRATGSTAGTEAEMLDERQDSSNRSDRLEDVDVHLTPQRLGRGSILMVLEVVEQLGDLRHRPQADEGAAVREPGDA
jgi:hypothetical protein